MYVSMSVCMSECMHAFMHVCMHACMYVCMHVCMYVCVCTRKHEIIYAHILVREKFVVSLCVFSFLVTGTKLIVHSVCVHARFDSDFCARKSFVLLVSSIGLGTCFPIATSTRPERHSQYVLEANVQDQAAECFGCTRDKTASLQTAPAGLDSGLAPRHQQPPPRDQLGKLGLHWL